MEPRYVVAGDPAAARLAAATARFDAEAAWRRSPAVAVRPEPFGALLYDFTTRRLSFLKSPELVQLVEGLGEHASALAAVDRAVAAGRLAESDRRRYLAALARLADDGTIELRDPGRPRRSAARPGHRSADDPSTATVRLEDP